jgi:hypothetical protein
MWDTEKFNLTMIKIIRLSRIAILLLGFMLVIGCRESSHQDMIKILSDLAKKNDTAANPFKPEKKLLYLDSLLKLHGNGENISVIESMAPLMLASGQEENSVKTYEGLIKHLDVMSLDVMMPDVAIAYMRLGERSNCMLNHNSSSCVFPLKDGGIHILKTGSQKAIETYETILKNHPDDLESKWLLNIAYMTLGEYPQNVPPAFLLPGLDADTGVKVKPFTDMAADLGLNVNSRAGGVIVDDFNNDGYLDIMTSGLDLNDPLHYFQNNGDGTFTDLTEKSGLKGLSGGLNIQQMDYNNDGNTDVFVLRGAWDKGFGNQPSSLLRNNGDGTFTDVTTTSGLLYYMPTQTAVWADFNNDGWLDVFVGAEAAQTVNGVTDHSCALYVNNHDGTFTNVTEQAHCNISGYVKGVTAADYNNDGWQDIFVSTLDGKKYLLKNKGKTGKDVDFEDVSAPSGIDKNHNSTFATWFYDYNNDGWPDLVVNDYSYTRNLGYYSAAEAMGKPVPGAGNIYLYRNNRDGTFTDVTKETGLNKVVFAMGCNFGDIDNDGYPDMYFGTGNPNFKSLVPNKMFKNIGGKRFSDVTVSSRTGNLQKGHGVAFADLRNTGNQDIFAEMGGAFIGDSYTSSLYVNPGQSNNNWISLKLEGMKANKAAIGSHIKLTFTENGLKRSVYKDVNSGGSFGSSPLRQEIGIGQAKKIDEIEIKWAGSQTIQRFKNVIPNRFLHITEGSSDLDVIHLAKLTFKKKPGIPICISPQMANNIR